MANVGVLFHPLRENAKIKADELNSWLALRGHSCQDVALETNCERLDLVVSLGGDGTMLRAIDSVSDLGIPVLGVNFGSLGYLTELNPDSLFDALELFFNGKYDIEERMTLQLTIESIDKNSHNTSDSKRAFSHFVALNEMVVEKLSSGHVIRVEVSIGDEEFLTYEADGLILSTPTGSTAYNFSARGPVVSPCLNALVITPISPHMLFDRSLVLEPTAKVKFRIADGPSAAVMVDGVQKVQLDPGESVTCTSNKVSARLVTFSRRDFHQILKLKFGLSSKQMGS